FMPTDNKKISAYVSDVIYDRFVQFQKEHKLSMSKAAIEIFAAYFEINLNSTVSTESNSELQSRVVTLEKEMSDLKQSYINLFKKVDLMQSTNELLIINPVEIPVDKDIYSEPDSSLQGELPKEDILEQPIDASIIDEPDSSLNSELLIIKPIEAFVDKDIPGELDSSLRNELPLQLVLESPNKIISDLNGSVDELFHALPIDTKFGALKISALAKRFNLSDAMVHKIRRFDINKQISYTASKDPDNRSWVYLESAKLFYPLKISE
ncbi:MAG: hypothetical protein RLZZ176_1903, partial [Cyanobacteriota bacterium]